MNALSPTPNQNTDLTKKVSELLDYIELDAHNSNACLDQGVMTKTAETLKIMFSDPVKFAFNTYSASNSELKRYVNKIVTRFLNYNKEEFYRIAKKPDSLTYFISFNHDSHDLRDQCYRFLDHYERIDFSTDFPVCFRFVSKKIADKFESDTVITLENGETSTTGIL